MRLGTREWVFPRIGAEPRSDRIREDVTCDIERCLVVAKNVLKSVPLPELLPARFGEVEAGILFRFTDEDQAVGIVAGAFDKQVPVIRHEAVRNDRELVFACRAKNLRPCQVNVRRIDEESPSLICAERQEISMKATIVDRLEVPWLIGAHADRYACGKPNLVHLKADTTSGHM